VPLHDLAVADGLRVLEAADAVHLAACESPGIFRTARHTSEAAVAVTDRAPQVTVGGVEVAGTGQARFAAQATPKNPQDPSTRPLSRGESLRHDTSRYLLTNEGI
jgi:hypothetical protein